MTPDLAMVMRSTGTRLPRHDTGIKQAFESATCSMVPLADTSQLLNECYAVSAGQKRRLSADSPSGTTSPNIINIEINDEMSGLQNVSQIKADIADQTFSFTDYSVHSIKQSQIIHYNQAWLRARGEYVTFISQPAPVQFSKEYVAERGRLVKEMLNQTFTAEVLRVLAKQESLNKLIELPFLFMDDDYRCITTDDDPNQLFGKFDPNERIQRFALTADEAIHSLAFETTFDPTNELYAK